MILLSLSLQILVNGVSSFTIIGLYLYHQVSNNVVSTVLCFMKDMAGRKSDTKMLILRTSYGQF